jgi:hypothetical protein
VQLEVDMIDIYLFGNLYCCTSLGLIVRPSALDSPCQAREQGLIGLRKDANPFEREGVD